MGEGTPDAIQAGMRNTLISLVIGAVVASGGFAEAGHGGRGGFGGHVGGHAGSVHVGGGFRGVARGGMRFGGGVHVAGPRFVGPVRGYRYDHHVRRYWGGHGWITAPTYVEPYYDPYYVAPTYVAPTYVAPVDPGYTQPQYPDPAYENQPQPNIAPAPAPEPAYAEPDGSPEAGAPVDPYDDQNAQDDEDPGADQQQP